VRVTADASILLTDSVHAHVCLHMVIIIINQPRVANRSEFFRTVCNPLPG